MNAPKELTQLHLKPAFDNIVKCGLSKEKASQEIGFALLALNDEPYKKDVVKILDNLIRKKGLTEPQIKEGLKKINNAVSQIGYTGLSLNPMKKEAALTGTKRGFGSGCFLIPMYGGLLKVAIAEGAIVAANCQVAYEKDELVINAGVMHNPVQHILKDFSNTRKVKVTYCVLKLPDGTEKFTPLYEDEYAKLAKMGVAYIHKGWADEMRKKSVLRKALKMVSSTRDSKLDYLFELDNMQYDLELLKKSPNQKKDNNNGTSAAVPETIPEKTDANPTGLPVFHKGHPEWDKAVKSIVDGVHTTDSLGEFVYISEAVKTELVNAASAKS